MQISARRIAAPLLIALAAACKPTEAAREQPDARAATPAAPITAPTSDSAALARADSARVQGQPSAPIWIVEISDYQCPFCRQWHTDSYERVKREVIDAGLARFAYVHFPLPSHRNAWPASEAAMCASLQGKFWEMHGAIFESQQRWGPLADPAPVFDSLASAHGVDAARMRQCMESDVTRPLIQADAERARDAGVNSTPTFIIGDVRLEGAYPYPELRKAVDSALARARR